MHTGQGKHAATRFEVLHKRSFLNNRQYIPECLDRASQKAQAYEDLIHWIVRGLVDLDCKSPDFWKLYDCRKALLSQMEVSDDEVLDYCRYR